MKKTLFKSLFVGFAALAGLTASAAGSQLTEGNRVYIEDFTINPGESKLVDIIMDNTIDVTQLQIYLTPSAGLTLRNAEGKWPNSLLETPRWTNTYYDEEEEEDVTYVFSPSKNEVDGQSRIIFISMKQVPFSGESGTAVVHLPVTAAADFTGGYITIDNWKMVAQNGDYAQGGTEYGTEEIRVNVSLPQAATPLATVVAEGVNNEEYTIADDLHIVARSDKGGYLFVSDGNNNWMKIKAGTELYDAMANWDDIKGGTLTGVLSEAECNQTLTISALPEEGTDAVNATANAWNLAQNDPTSATYNFAPKVNEVILLTGYWFDGEFRGYSSNKGQSATANFGWCDTDNTMSNGTLYKDVLSVAQLKEPWSNNAPAKIAATDELAFQNYLIYPLAIEANNILTGVENLNAGKDIVEVQYVNAAGMVSNTPFKGVNMVVTRYADGSQKTTKVVK